MRGGSGRLGHARRTLDPGTRDAARAAAARPVGLVGAARRVAGRLATARRPAALLAACLAASAADPLVPSGKAAAQAPDTTLAQEGVYARPFIVSGGGTSIGGYVEGNTNWFREDGVGEGFSSELRRFNVFLFSQISPRVRFLSELEFEHGAEEIELETALVDFVVRPSLVLRAGIVLPPLGYFNQNHDAPRWDFVDRPLVSTTIIPSTLSEVGAGIYGKVPVRGVVLSYDLYVTNGLGDGIVENDTGRTDIAAGKREDQFEEDNNGTPALSARVAARRPGLGEIGFSWYGGAYNSFRLEGERVEEKRRVDIFALDAGARVGPAEVRGEVAWADVDVPPGMAEVFGDRQWGAHVDVVVPVWRPRLAGYDAARLAAVLRFERVDYNKATFSSTGASIGDEVTAIVPGIALRPTPDTVFRVNYRYHWIRDFVGNPLVRRAGLQVGVATYF